MDIGRRREIDEFILLEHLFKEACGESPEINFEHNTKAKTRHQGSQTTDLLEKQGKQDEWNEYLIKTLENEIAELKKEKKSWSMRERNFMKAMEERKAEISRESLKKMEDEIKQLRKTNLLLTKNKKAEELLPSKRERAEVELLRRQLQMINEDRKESELRHGLTIERLNKRIAQLRNENDELKEQVTIIDRERLAALQALESERIATIKSSSKEEIANRALTDFQRRVGLENESVLSERFPTTTKCVRTLENGCKLCWYVNGTLKKADRGGSYCLFYSNGDFHQFLEDGTSIYWYELYKTLKIKNENGPQTLVFKDGQVERRFPNGAIQIMFSDATIKAVSASGMEEFFFPEVLKT
ncbi:hypothetical protein HDU97_002550 [Phlyctochytrium planicorne]|nr:hypothetical protein HDU97_002550 [Phlyctochytrium planicorne]